MPIVARAGHVVLAAALGYMASGCFATTRFGPTAVAALEPLSADARGGARSTWLEPRGGGELVEVARTTRLTLEAHSARRAFELELSPGELVFRADAISIPVPPSPPPDGVYMASHERPSRPTRTIRLDAIDGLRVRRFSLGRTLLAVLLAPVATLITLITVFLPISCALSPCDLTMG